MSSPIDCVNSLTGPSAASTLNEERKFSHCTFILSISPAKLLKLVAAISVAVPVASNDDNNSLYLSPPAANICAAFAESTPNCFTIQPVSPACAANVCIIVSASLIPSALNLENMLRNCVPASEPFNALSPSTSAIAEASCNERPAELAATPAIFIVPAKSPISAEPACEAFASISISLPESATVWLN